VGADLILELDRAHFRAGEEVTGMVGSPAGGRARAVWVEVRYRERTESFSSCRLALSSGALHEGELAPGWSSRFAVRLPADILPGYRSTHGELWWEVGAVSDRIGPDAQERRRIEVLP